MKFNSNSFENLWKFGVIYFSPQCLRFPSNVGGQRPVADGGFAGWQPWGPGGREKNFTLCEEKLM